LAAHPSAPPTDFTRAAELGIELSPTPTGGFPYGFNDPHFDSPSDTPLYTPTIEVSPTLGRNIPTRAFGYFYNTPTPRTPTMMPSPSATLTPTLIPTLPPPTPRAGTSALTAYNSSGLQLLNILEATLRVNTNDYAYWGNFNLGFNQDGREYATVTASILTIWSPDTGERLREIALSPESPLVASAITRDFTRAAFMTESGEFVLVSLASDGNFTEIIREQVGSVSAYDFVTFSADGTHLALSLSSSDIPYVQVRSGLTGAVFYPLPLSRDRGTARFTATNQLLLTTPIGISIYEREGEPVLSYSARQYRDNYYGSRSRGAFQVSPSLEYAAQILDRLNVELTRIGVEDSEPLLLQGHTCPLEGLAFSNDSSVLLSRDSCGNARFWDADTGETVVPIDAAPAFPNGILLAQKWLLIGAGGYVTTLEPTGWQSSSSAASNLSVRNLQLSPDGTALAVDLGRFVGIYGIPSETRPMFQKVFGRIIPITVNVRSAPSFNAPIIAAAVEGSVIIAGRDSSGQFVYLPRYEGWVNAGENYLEIYGTSVVTLPLSPASPNP